MSKAGRTAGLIGAAVTVAVAVLVVVVLWVATLNAPSAGRDPDFAGPALAPTRTPTPIGTPPSSEIAATLEDIP